MAKANDTFVEAGASNVTLASHTPTGADAGSGWTSFGGGEIMVDPTDDLCFDNNTGNGNRYRMNTDLGSDEMDVQADVWIDPFAQFCAPGLSGRNPNAASQGVEFYYDKGTGAWTLDDGVSQDTATESFGGTFATIKLEIRNGSIKGYVDGVEKCSLASNEKSGNQRAGIMLLNFDGDPWTNSMELDNYQSEGITSAPSSVSENQTVAVTEGRSLSGSNSSNQTVSVTEGRALSGDSSQNQAVPVSEALAVAPSTTQAQTISVAESLSNGASSSINETVGAAEDAIFQTVFSQSEAVAPSEAVANQATVEENQTVVVAETNINQASVEENEAIVVSEASSHFAQIVISETVTVIDEDLIDNGNTYSENVDVAEAVSFEFAYSQNEQFAPSEQSGIESAIGQNQTVSISETVAQTGSAAVNDATTAAEAAVFEAAVSQNQGVSVVEADQTSVDQSNVLETELLAVAETVAFVVNVSANQMVIVTDRYGVIDYFSTTGVLHSETNSGENSSDMNTGICKTHFERIYG